MRHGVPHRYIFTFQALSWLVVTVLFAASARAADTFDVGAVGLSETSEKVSWHGYYEFEYWDVEGKNGSFDAHKITVWMGVKLSEKAYLSSEVEYEHAPKLEGDGGSGAIKVDSAQLRLTPFDSTALYFGVFYAPFGIEYLSYPGHKNKLVTRPKVMKSGGIIPGTWSDVGAGVSQAVAGVGHVDLFAVNGDAHNGGVSRDSSAGGNENKTLGVRVMLDGFREGINVGASYVSGKWDENDDHASIRYGAHLRLDGDVLTGIGYAPVLIAEYVTGRDEAASSLADEDKDVNGYYAQLSFRPVSALELAARYGAYENDGKAADNQKTETSVGFSLDVVDNVRLKGEYQWNAESGVDVDNNAAVVQLVAWW